MAWLLLAGVPFGGILASALALCVARRTSASEMHHTERALALLACPPHGRRERWRSPST